MASHPTSASDEPRRLSSGNYCDCCEDCGTMVIAPTAEDVLGAGCRCQSGRIQQTIADLVCMSCGREVGTVPINRQDTRVLVLSPLRCSVCGGSPVVADVRTVTIYPKLPPMPGPRRGRPPGSGKRAA